MSPIVLLVDEGHQIDEMLRSLLLKEGLRVLMAHKVQEALALTDTAGVDLVVTDVSLPDDSGVALCRRIRQHSKAPVIMLTASMAEADRVLALDAGADDCMIKPVRPTEFMAKIRAHLRRWAWMSMPIAQPDRLEVGELVLDVAGHAAYFRGQELHLTPTEYSILRVLCRAPGRVFSRERLLNLATGQQVTGSARNVDVHIHALRLKLEQDPQNPGFLKTVRGGGYCIGRHNLSRSSSNSSRLATPS